MPRPPSIQWYYKQWLGDNKVQGMEWDAYGMHFHLLNLSIQEEPPGSLPNDMVLMRRWLRNPPDDVWRRVQPQVFSAWSLRGDRWFNAGMVATFERKQHYANRVPYGMVPNQYETGTKKGRDSLPSVNKEVVSSFESKERSFAEECEGYAPEGFDSSALAIGLLGRIGMTSVVANIRSAAAAIDLAAKELEISPAKATDWHFARVSEERARGGKVNRFYFDDGMQRWTGGPGGTPETCERCGGPKWLPSKLVRGQVKECDCKEVPV